MTTKEYLRQVYKLHKHIERIRARREQLRSEMYSIKSPSGDLNPDKVQSTLTGDKLLQIIAKVDELERELVDEMKRLIEAQERIIKEIEAVPVEVERDVLYRRYVLFQRWEQIAYEMNVSARHIYRIHGQALQTFAKCH